MMPRYMEKLHLLSLTQDQLKATLAEHGLPSFTSKQIMEWVYQKRVSDFSLMSNLSKANREKLPTLLDTDFFSNLTILPSSDGMAIKYVFTLLDGAKIEAVVLKEKTYTTLCVSSQAGCPVDCKFCLTGVVGFKRHLKAQEIVGQVFKAIQDGHDITHLVFMGMGEPLLNYDAVFAAIDILQAPWGFDFSKRKITVSTSGYLAGIKRLIADQRFISLAFSVGNANPEKRAVLMPIENRNPIMDVAKALHTYQKMHNRKLTLEYTLLDGKNDAPADIRELCSLAKYLHAKINLINLNPHPKIPFKPVSTKVLHRVKHIIEEANVPVTVRYRKGQDISAACGQLGESYL
jgi:23S rRNA (adenine2503-C2)-methyltransferase